MILVLVGVGMELLTLLRRCFSIVYVESMGGVEYGHFARAWQRGAMTLVEGQYLRDWLTARVLSSPASYSKMV